MNMKSMIIKRAVVASLVLGCMTGVLVKNNFNTKAEANHPTKAGMNVEHGCRWYGKWL